jgi:hypothetical protein
MLKRIVGLVLFAAGAAEMVERAFTWLAYISGFQRESTQSGLSLKVQWFAAYSTLVHSFLVHNAIMHALLSLGFRIPTLVVESGLDWLWCYFRLGWSSFTITLLSTHKSVVSCRDDRLIGTKVHVCRCFWFRREQFGSKLISVSLTFHPWSDLNMTFMFVLWKTYVLSLLYFKVLTATQRRVILDFGAAVAWLLVEMDYVLTSLLESPTVPFDGNLLALVLTCPCQFKGSVGLSTARLMSHMRFGFELCYILHKYQIQSVLAAAHCAFDKEWKWISVRDWCVEFWGYTPHTHLLRQVKLSLVFGLMHFMTASLSMAFELPISKCPYKCGLTSPVLLRTHILSRHFQLCLARFMTVTDLVPWYLTWTSLVLVILSLPPFRKSTTFKGYRVVRWQSYRFFHMNSLWRAFTLVVTAFGYIRLNAWIWFELHSLCLDHYIWSQREMRASGVLSCFWFEIFVTRLRWYRDESCSLHRIV